jgi:hypothetical protein
MAGSRKEVMISPTLEARPQKILPTGQTPRPSCWRSPIAAQRAARGPVAGQMRRAVDVARTHGRT